jgi:hypothetical protein
MNALIPPFANIYSSSNYLDIIDYQIDKSNNITTLPVLYGNNTALVASLTANTMSLLSHINHPNFFNNPINYLFQAQNVFSGVTLFNKNPIDFRKDDTPKMKLHVNKIHLKPYPVMSPFIPRCLPKMLV